MRDQLLAGIEKLNSFDIPESNRWAIMPPYKVPRSKKWRLHKKRMKERWMGLFYKRDAWKNAPTIEL